MTAAIAATVRAVSVRPADFPPPYRPDAYLAPPDGPADLRIDVGAAFVGAGPAGLAGAVRLAQLLADDPAAAERLGELPIVVLEKGKAVGSHTLSGAVVNPAALRELLPGRSLEELSSYGEVRREAVHFLTGRRSLRLPTPPPFHNKGNHVFSLSRLVRRLAEEAEELGVTVLPETDAHALLVEDGAVRGVRTGAKGLGRDGSPKPGSAPPTDIVAQATVLAEGTQGHLAGVAVDRFGLEGRHPQIYALGVKEVWRVARPLDRVLHTLGWPLRAAARYGEFGGSFVYPMGEDRIAIGLVVGLDYADARLSVHDLLQEFKTHPLIRRLLEGGERLAWGAKTIPEGGWYALPRRLDFPGGVLCGDSAGFVNVPKLKGVHYAMRSGMLAAEAIHAALRAGTDLGARDALRGYHDAVKRSEIARDLYRVRNMRQAFSGGLVVGGALAGLMDVTGGRFPRRERELHPDAWEDVEDLGRSYPPSDGTLTFDKLSSVYLSGNRTRDDQPNHLLLHPGRVPRALAETWVNLCPAAVYELDEGTETADGTVALRMAPSNCVQCGAIGAKGGRLTPP
ncbi:MAG: Electron transfer flavoprotein-ubiquinone oxidoreductase, partial [uncultured Thermoleophilia bacterium]